MKTVLITKKQVEAFVSEGKSSKDISEITGLNARTIRWYFKKYQIDVPKFKSHTAWNKGIKAANDERVMRSVLAANNSIRGKTSWNNKGGYINPEGYKILYINGKRKREHVHIMELSIGRKIFKNECIHHKDGNKLNNDISNLVLLLKKDHASLHYPKGSKFGKNISNSNMVKEN